MNLRDATPSLTPERLRAVSGCPYPLQREDDVVDREVLLGLDHISYFVGEASRVSSPDTEKRAMAPLAQKINDWLAQAKERNEHL